MDTRKSLEDEVLGWLDETGDTGTTQTNVRNAIQQAHAQRVSQELWPFMLWSEPQTFNLVVGQKNYTLHSEYGRPFYFRNVTQVVPLKERPSRHFQSSHTNEVNRFALWNRSPVAAQPAAAAKVVIASSDAGDTGSSRGIYVRGMTASGMVDEVITPTGTTEASSVATFVAGGIVQLSKFGTWTGTCTVEDESENVLVVLHPDQNAKSYQQIRMLWTPTAADQIEYLFFRHPSELLHDYSVPDIPYPHSRIVVWDALLNLAAYDGRIDAGRKAIWNENQRVMDLALRQAYLEGQSLEAESLQVHYVDDDE